MKKYILIAVLTLIVLLVAGCSEKSATDNVNTKTTTKTETKVPAKQTTTDAPIDNELVAEFKDLIDTKTEIQYKVNYDFTTIAMNQTISGKMAQYVKSTNARTDYSMQGVETRSYFIDKELTSCTKVSKDWNCMKIEYKPDEVSNTEADFKKNPTNYKIVRDGTKLVANINAKCFKLTNLNQNITARYCFSNDAIPLYINMQLPGLSTEMMAMSYSKTLLPTDFDLPATAATVESGKAGDPCMSCNYLTGDMKDQCMASCK